MEHLIIMYKLKSGVTMEDFLKFSKEIDRPTVLDQEGVHGFEVYTIVSEDNEKQEYDVVENILVDSFAKWVEIGKTEPMLNNAKVWNRYGDENSIKILIGNRV